MEQFVLVLSSLYNNNRSLKTQAATKQELPKHQVEKCSAYQTDSVKNEVDKKLSDKADSLFDKISSCFRIKLSNPQNLILDGVENGFLL